MSIIICIDSDLELSSRSGNAVLRIIYGRTDLEGSAASGPYNRFWRVFLVCCFYFKESLNASKPSEYPFSHQACVDLPRPPYQVGSLFKEKSERT